jgi:RNA polymerase sigma-70 factor (sigma-E family)
MSHDSLPPASVQPTPAPTPAPEPLVGYTAFFEREFPRVVRTVYLIVRDLGRAEDLSQEAFIQLLRHWKKVSSYERPESWVRRVAIRLATRHAHRERLRSLLERKTAVPSYETEPSVDILHALRTLSVNQRAAIVLYYYEDLSVDEVAEILECSQNTVKSHLHRARTSLRPLLADQPGGHHDD